MSKGEPVVGERLVSQFTPEQRGWMVAAFIAFLGIAYVGPAYTRAAETSRTLTKRALTRRTWTTRSGKRLRRLGGGAIKRIKRGF